MVLRNVSTEVRVKKPILADLVFLSRQQVVELATRANHGELAVLVIGF
ncbi:hypothetical protein [Rhodococcoides fascians]|nr:hypothetical protein [Rhodococcus fascians]